VSKEKEPQRMRSCTHFSLCDEIYLFCLVPKGKYIKTDALNFLAPACMIMPEQVLTPKIP
jgi:hypothetical protein